MSDDETSDSSTIIECFTNIELVTNICKFLSYKQQLQLLQVSGALEHIIVNFIWKTKFKKVEVYATNETNVYFVSNIIEKDIYLKKYLFFFNFLEIIYKRKLLLQACDLKSFLNLNVRNITELHIKYKSNLAGNIGRYPFLKQNFINLKCLIFERVTLRNADLRKVVTNFINLESLAFIDCFNWKNQPLVLDDDIDIQIFKNMQNLKNLIIRFSDDKEPLLRFSNVRNILNELSLQRLNLDFPIKPDISKNKKDLNCSNLKYLKVFEIGHFEKLVDFIDFQTNILPNFESLCNLTLNDFSITEKFFNILLTSCKNLTHLSFYSCRINGFQALAKLQEFNIYFCEDITLSQLKIILNEMHLKCFKTISTQYVGYLESFPFSSTLETFYCDFTDEKLVELLKFNNKNLQNLSHFHWDIRSPKNFSMRLSDFAPNLTVLHIQKLQLNINDFYQLKFLQKLFLDMYDSMDVFESLLLLKHKNLKELTIKDCYALNEDVDLNQARAFKTNLLYLNICGRAFKVLKDFCLDLLQLNGKLSLTCFGLMNTDMILKVVNSENFPCRFATINICGISIDCRSIQNNCTETLTLIKLLVDIFKCSTEDCYFQFE